MITEIEKMLLNHGNRENVEQRAIKKMKTSGENI